MSKQKVLILDKERIARKMQRMAYELWEHNSHETHVTLLGIEGSGFAVAQNLAERLKHISPLMIDVLPLTVNKKNPKDTEIKIPADISGKSVVLVDDVANSGKTLLYALRPILNYDVKKIMVAVLVDRKHKAYPVSSDIVGHSVATTIQEHIEVETNGNEITAAYLM